MEINKEELLQVALKAVFEAKNISLKVSHDFNILSSYFKDIKTRVDIEMNDVIISCLKSTGFPILSEERGGENLGNVYWIVDPLDGTLNFTRGFDCYSISISLWMNDSPQLGVVYDIGKNRVYTSKNNNGAWEGEKKIQVSTTNKIQEAILATGFPSGANYHTEILLSIVAKIQIFKKIRAIGSASLMLSLVASGVFDVYYEKDIYLWDVAAGLSLVKEAGGEYLIRKSGNDYRYEVLATNGLLFQECKNILFK